PDEFYRGGNADNSNTQFAILALLAARRHEVPLDAPLALLNRRFRATQNPDGSWNYRGRGTVSPQPTMTCAGLLGMAVGFGLKHRAGRADQGPAVVRGLEDLSRAVGEPGQHAGGVPSQRNLYFLWSVERVGVLYQLKTINGKRWYEWGVEALTTDQRPD